MNSFRHQAFTRHAADLFTGAAVAALVLSASTAATVVASSAQSHAPAVVEQASR